MGPTEADYGNNVSGATVDAVFSFFPPSFSFSYIVRAPFFLHLSPHPLSRSRSSFLIDRSPRLGPFVVPPSRPCIPLLSTGITTVRAATFHFKPRASTVLRRFVVPSRSDDGKIHRSEFNAFPCFETDEYF